LVVGTRLAIVYWSPNVRSIVKPTATDGSSTNDSTTIAGIATSTKWSDLWRVTRSAAWITPAAETSKSTALDTTTTAARNEAEEAQTESECEVALKWLRQRKPIYREKFHDGLKTQPDFKQKTLEISFISSSGGTLAVF
jgi:hypothetical protein